MSLPPPAAMPPPASAAWAVLPLRPGAAARSAELALRNPVRFDTATGVLQHVTRHARTHPDAPAVTDGDRVVGYDELAGRARGLAGALAAAGVRAGDLVAAAGPRSAETVVTFLALERLGAVYLPVDPQWPQRRTATVLAVSGARHLLDYADGTADTTAARAAAADSGAAVHAFGDLNREGAPSEEPDRPAERDHGREPRYCIFTSGTTGRPKGALVEHQGMANHLWAKVHDLGLTAADRVAFTAPLVFDISIWQMLTPLAAGATVVVARDTDLAFPRRLTSLLDRAAVTVVELVPTMVGWVADDAERRGADSLSRLRWLISTGEELPVGLARRVLTVAPHVRLLNAYGPTECSDDVTHHEVRAADLDLPRLPVGAAVPNAVLYLLTDDDGVGWRTAEPGETGQLFVGGVAVGLGYRNDPDTTAGAFFADPFDPHSPTGRLYRTGDAARLADGRVFYLGRIDRQVKVAGVRMELDEIEVVLRRHAAVDACAVTVVTTDGRPDLAAFVTLRTAGTDHTDLLKYLAEELPDAMVPRHLLVLDALPLTGNGKTDHRALAGLVTREAP
ncbi:amino acid adenylation domain-containing protein [Dactylosporangium sp. NPDC000555]|uniref:amino acid adenylation domain-containing protein n=1 Tax=Dactylosporangium sp. NPDC000555 TaxID=3154260 RepID=UPI0033254B8B